MTGVLTLVLRLVVVKSWRWTQTRTIDRGRKVEGKRSRSLLNWMGRMRVLKVKMLEESVVMACHEWREVYIYPDKLLLLHHKRHRCQTSTPTLAVVIAISRSRTE